MSETGNFTFDWCLSFVETLADSGVKHAIISPGSRSTPLTLAFAAHPRIKKTVVLDERSAAFTALGIGKITGMPAAIVCTSGTAAANYYPAVVEASMTGVPLLVLTTDRPPYLRSVGASQAIDQLKMFGDYPRFFFEAGEPVNKEKDLKRLRLLALQSFHKSVNLNGPVHVNFAFRKPLEPEQKHYSVRVERLAQSEPNPSKKIVSDAGKAITIFPDWLIDRIKRSERPLLITGEISPTLQGDGPAKLASQLKAPLLAEAFSQLTRYRSMEPSPYIYGFDAFLKSADTRKRLLPDLILRFGESIISNGVNQWLKHCESAEQIVLSTSGELPDPTLSAKDFCTIPSYEFDLSDIPERHDFEWMKQWKQLSDTHLEKTSTVLEGTDSLTDGHVHFRIAPEIPEDWLVMLSNSYAVRDFDFFGFRYSGKGPILVNRGASGIDGVTSTFLGAVVATRKNGILITGDLAFLHDTNALLSRRAVSPDQTLIIVVLNNSGGSIFRMLPIASHEEVYSTYFETSQDVDLDHLCKAYDIEFKRVEKNMELIDEFRVLIHKKGIHIIECVTNSVDSMNLRSRISR